MASQVMIHLLGAPRIEVPGGSDAHLRGRKSWAVLAYLALTRRPASRQHLSALLFPDADDPLGALRWALADLRRTLGSAIRLTGDPVELHLAAGTTVDAELVLTGTGEGWRTAVPGELLEGIHLEGCPSFDTWLEIERRRVGAACEAVLHEQALRHLGYGRLTEAVSSASRLVELNPLEENNQVLLVRCLTAAGQTDTAREQVERCTRLFHRELDVVPSAALETALRAGRGSTHTGASRGREAALAQLEAGQAAVNAGAVDAGLECLRRAVGDAAAAGEDEIRVRALIALGSALVHGVRGRDEEGAAVLHEALARAEDAGERRAAARITRELAFVDVQAGRRHRADTWLDRAVSLTDDEAELAAVLGIRGMNLSDSARYAEALTALDESVGRAHSSGAPRQAAWSSSLVGRVHLLRGDSAAAAEALDHSLEIVRAESWVAFAPWPESLRAEVDRTEGRPGPAHSRLEHAFALACQLGDPCWEGIAARGVGLLEADGHDLPAALRWLEDAGLRCGRWPDAYQWIRGHVLDATCTVAIACGHPRASTWVEELSALAARGEMAELVARSHVHRAHLGRPGAVEAAVDSAAGLDNPLVAEMVSAL
ncbi:AfsR/SARP family transcriptional regulator [Nocardioides sp. URHA0020]|uniref:AfsR/SARP family transcriptional regulator n=1 Tax=Nocardioides sp. URHA0020 TaxID=1380392 RepID=UPI00049141DD|nr:BTAD domain-containing putative transcriptional regulator [Nocardioides sp. URHA0020]